MSTEELMRRRGRPATREPQSIQSLVKALSILDFLAHAPDPVGVTEVAKGVGVPTATAHRLLATMHAHEAVSYDANSQRYSLGSSIMRYGLLGLQRLEIHRVARPFLEKLHRDTGETVVFARRQGFTKIFLDQIESKEEIRRTLPLGERLQLYVGSGGHAILAFLTPAEQEEYLAMAPFPSDYKKSSSIVDAPGLRAEINRIRQQGYAVTRSDHATSVSAPILDHLGVVVGAINACGPSFRFTEDRVEKFSALVKGAAQGVSAELGYSARRD